MHPLLWSPAGLAISWGPSTYFEVGGGGGKARLTSVGESADPAGSSFGGFGLVTSFVFP